MKHWGWRIIVAVMLAWGAGCGSRTRVSDEEERDHPAMRKARGLEQAGDLDGAQRTYQSLLERDPPMARAHLALAFLRDKQRGQEVDAIYHFRRYLALRPETEKRGMIEDHIRQARLRYVASVYTNEAAVLGSVAALEKENASLRVRCANLDLQVRYLRESLSARQPGAGVPKEAPAGRGAGMARPPKRGPQGT